SQTHDHAVSDLPGLRRLKFAQWTKAGENPVRRWRHFEKALEIHLTLLECERANIEAQYFSVDVSDAAAVADACEQIRRQNGAIRGVIQGAGSGQDARFDRKRTDKVRQCLSAKIDGTAALAAATHHDALEWFIGFGSISGRFGANGHTDYSAANDMMAKMIGRLGRERPATRCVTFHWHAWGDVGMATKPEAKLALDLIGMDFMPAAEGLQHFLDEIESGGDEAEVLITDRKYVRKFFPSQVIGKQAIAPEQLGERLLPPLLDPHGVHPAGESQDRQRFQATFDANVDPFLKEHRVGGRATLPMAIAIECFAEASFGPRRFDDEATRVLTNIRAHHPLKPLEDHAFAIEVVRDGQSSGETDAARWHLVSDLRRRDGRLVQAARTYFEATSTLESASTLESTSTRALDRQGTPSGLATNWHTLIYADESAPVYHGPPLRCLRRAGWSDPSTREIWLGQIVARSPLELAGHWRPLTGWVLDPAVLDAVFYAVGMYAIETCQRPSLPVSIGRLEMGRRPDPGEVLRVEVRRGNSLLQQQGGTIVDATLWGQNGDRLLRLVDYRVAWLLENASQTSYR
ncbi:MAG: SDR family NAD(P)-dependent oxidoreductase, partial [Planctomycetota bacterium]